MCAWVCVRKRVQEKYTFGIHLMNKRCRTNAVNFCFPSLCVPKRYHLFSLPSLFIWLCVCLCMCTPCVRVRVFFFYIFAFHLINLDGLFVYDVAHPSKSIYVSIKYIEMESVKVDSSFIWYVHGLMAIFIPLCWTSNDVDLLWFDQIAAVLQITLCLSISLSLSTRLKSGAAFLSFSSDHIFARPFFISQKGLRYTYTHKARVQ